MCLVIKIKQLKPLMAKSVDHEMLNEKVRSMLIFLLAENLLASLLFVLNKIVFWLGVVLWV